MYKLFVFFILIFGIIYGDEKKVITDYEPKIDITYIALDNCLNFTSVHGVYSPFLVIGARQIFKLNALDWNVGIELYPVIKSKFKLICYNVNCNYLKFFESKNGNRNYIGIGGNIDGLYLQNYSLVYKSPSFIIGKQISENNHYYFIQLKINWPNYPTITIYNYKYRVPKKEKNKRFWTANTFVMTGVGF